MKNNKSLILNAALNSIRTIVSLLFPLITFPYVSRVLGVDNVGMYSYSSSIVNYFALFAALGINTYAIREGSRYRDDRIYMSRFFSQIYSINLITTAISYALLFLMLFLSNKFEAYTILILIYSTTIIFKTIGCEWVYNIYEEYAYITIRSIIIQILSVVMLFVFVKNPDDLVNYVAISAISGGAANILNRIFLNKYVDVGLTKKMDVRIHLIPILLIFANTITTTIYVSSDVTILGFMTNDYHVGLYSTSTKIYTILKSMIAAIITVAIPRLSFLWGNNLKEDFIDISNRVLQILIVTILPISIGIFMLSDEIINIIAGSQYAEATISLKLLSIALFICLFSWFYTSCILIPAKKEKSVLVASIIAAGANILLNIILIPYYYENAAAATTIIAELISACICCFVARKIYPIKIPVKDVLSDFIAGASIVGICLFCEISITNIVMKVCVAIIGSALSYSSLLFLFRNSAFLYLLAFLKSKIFYKKVNK